MDATEQARPLAAPSRAVEHATKLLASKLDLVDHLIAPQWLPDATTLREIRDLVSHPAFRRVAKAVGGDPSSHDLFVVRIQELAHRLGDRAASWKSKREGLVTLGVSGGVSGVTGTFATALTLPLSPLTVLPICFGAACIALSLRTAERLETERHLYEQLAEEMLLLAKEIGHE